MKQNSAMTVTALVCNYDLVCKAITKAENSKKNAFSGKQARLQRPAVRVNFTTRTFSINFVTASCRSFFH